MSADRHTVPGMMETPALDREQHDLPFSRRPVGAAVVVGVLACGALFAGHVIHQTPFMSAPDRISTCGRDYSGPGTDGTLAVVKRSGAHVIDHIWTWQGRREVWGQRVTIYGSRSCGTGVYLRVRQNSFRAYGLMGGP